jgi:hypothetical protein
MRLHGHPRTARLLPAARNASGLLQSIVPPEKRAREIPGAVCARSLACKKAHKTSHCGCSRISPAFPAAMVLRFPSCSPRRPGLLSPSAAQRVSVVAVLISASGDQAHTTSPSAISTVRLSVDSRPSHPAPNVRDDRETPLLIGRDEQIVARDLPVVTRKSTCDTLARRAISTDPRFRNFEKSRFDVAQRAAGSFD